MTKEEAQKEFMENFIKISQDQSLIMWGCSLMLNTDDEKAPWKYANCLFGFAKFAEEKRLKENGTKSLRIGLSRNLNFITQEAETMKFWENCVKYGFLPSDFFKNLKSDENARYIMKINNIDELSLYEGYIYTCCFRDIYEYPQLIALTNKLTEIGYDFTYSLLIAANAFTAAQGHGWTAGFSPISDKTLCKIIEPESCTLKCFRDFANIKEYLPDETKNLKFSEVLRKTGHYRISLTNKEIIKKAKEIHVEDAKISPISPEAFSNYYQNEQLKPVA